MNYGDWIALGAVLIAFGSLGLTVFKTRHSLTHEQSEEDRQSMVDLRTELRDARSEVAQLRTELREARDDLEQAQRDRAALQKEMTAMFRRRNPNGN